MMIRYGKERAVKEPRGKGAFIVGCRKWWEIAWTSSRGAFFFGRVFERQWGFPLFLFSLFLPFAVDMVYLNHGPLAGVLINSAHSHLPSCNKRKTPIHIPYLIYPLYGTKVRLACKEKRMGRNLALWSWCFFCVRVYMYTRVYVLCAHGRLRDVTARCETYIIFILADRSVMPSWFIQRET